MKFLERINQDFLNAYIAKDSAICCAGQLSACRTTFYYDCIKKNYENGGLAMKPQQTLNNLTTLLCGMVMIFSNRNESHTCS